MCKIRTWACYRKQIKNIKSLIENAKDTTNLWIISFMWNSILNLIININLKKYEMLIEPKILLIQVFKIDSLTCINTWFDQVLDSTFH